MNEVECWYHYFLDRQACNNYAAYLFLAHIGSILTKVWVWGWLLPPQELATMLKRDESTIYRWLKAYKQGGITLIT